MFISILSLFLKHNYCYYTWVYYNILIIMGKQKQLLKISKFFSGHFKDARAYMRICVQDATRLDSYDCNEKNYNHTSSTKSNNNKKK